MQIFGRPGGASAQAPSGAGALPPTLAEQIAAMRRRYRRMDARRALAFWWYRIALVVLGGCLGAILGEVVTLQWKIVLAVLLAPLIVFLMVRRLEVGLVLMGAAAAPLFPSVASVKSVNIYPAEAALGLLLVAVLVLAAFRVRVFVWPSLWATWPQIGIIALAIISEIMIQVTWTPQVPHRINSTPVLYSELLGIVQYCVPLAVIVVTTACLTGREHWIVRLEHAILLLAGLAALMVCIEFKRIGADIYMYRYSEPMIFYMQLGALAQYMGLGAMIAYARALCADRWRMRLAYLALTALCVAAVYFTLENSRWVYTGVGLIIITLMFSRRLFVALCALSLPLIPVALSVVSRIQAVKGTRDVNRFTVWQDMLRIWSKHPVFGVGPGNVWSYDQISTNLPLYLRNLAADGLGVAHNGVLQILTELGPLGVICYYAFALLVIIMAIRLYRRSRLPEQRADRVLALICLGLVVGSLAADPVSGIFFLPPSQIGGWNDLPRVMSTWIMFGCLIYKDTIWRTGRRVAEMARRRVSPDDEAEPAAAASAVVTAPGDLAPALPQP